MEIQLYKIQKYQKYILALFVKMMIDLALTILDFMEAIKQRCGEFFSHSLIIFIIFSQFNALSMVIKSKRK